MSASLPFSPPDAGGRRRRWAALVPLALLALLLVRPLAPALAAGEKDPDPPPADVLALLDPDVDRQAAALARLRQNPEAARQGLLQALQGDDGPPERWRLIYRMVEFGHAEDVPLLLERRDKAANEWERRVAEGAVRALYDPVGAVVGLEGVVQDFSFIQTRRPEREGSGEKWRLSSWSLADYHRDDVPLVLIQRLQDLRNKSYRDKDDLAGAMEKRVGPRAWKEHRERLMASVETILPSVTLRGLARVRLSNPLDRPLLLTVSLGVWYGRFDTPPPTTWVYLEPRANRTVDLPVAPQGSAERGQLRMDLRLGEVDGPLIPGFHKLYLPLSS